MGCIYSPIAGFNNGEEGVGGVRSNGWMEEWGMKEIKNIYDIWGRYVGKVLLTLLQDLACSLVMGTHSHQSLWGRQTLAHFLVQFSWGGLFSTWKCRFQSTSRGFVCGDNANQTRQGCLQQVWEV